MGTLIRTTLIVFCSTSAIRINSYLYKQGLDPLLSIAIASITAAVFYRVLLYLLCELPLMFEPLRPFFDPRATAEGIWLQTLEGDIDHQYSIVFITYNKHSKTFSLKGNNFNAEGDQKGNWSSLLVEIDVQRDNLSLHWHTSEV